MSRAGEGAGQKTWSYNVGFWLNPGQSADRH